MNNSFLVQLPSLHMKVDKFISLFTSLLFIRVSSFDSITYILPPTLDSINDSTLSTNTTSKNSFQRFKDEPRISLQAVSHRDSSLSPENISYIRFLMDARPSMVET
uniref:Uncharacterized protein n=1 Tax=Lepeophtheirus salmonis TaxID=72036 RepID=A0A0K2UDA1_LEPSM